MRPESANSRRARVSEGSLGFLDRLWRISRTGLENLRLVTRFRFSLVWWFWEEDTHLQASQL